MPANHSRPPLIAGLWFLAAALALIAAGIPLLEGRAPNWGVAAPGLFCLVMGIASLSRREDPPGPSA